MPHLLGYARVSTADQNPDLQLDALRAAGCYRLFVDTASGALDERPELAKVLDQLRPSDTLVVWKLDRLGRSLRHRSLRRFQPPKRYAVLLCFLQAALAETADAVVEAQDKLITSIHSKAKKRRDALLRASEEAKRRAVEVLEVMGDLVLDDSIPDVELRAEILLRIPNDEMTTLVDGCRQLRTGTTPRIWASPRTGTATPASTRRRCWIRLPSISLSSPR